jgi:hypothetical protein
LPGARDSRNRPSLSVLNEVTAPFSFATEKTAFGSGATFGTSDPFLMGPGRIGLTITTPSIPVPRPASDSPEERFPLIRRSATNSAKLPRNIRQSSLTCSDCIKPFSRISVLTLKVRPGMTSPGQVIKLSQQRLYVGGIAEIIRPGTKGQFDGRATNAVQVRFKG